MAAQVISPVDGTKIGTENSNNTIIIHYIEIPNARDDPQIISLARWAVDEYNKQPQGRSLIFTNVYRASFTPMGQGTSYAMRVGAIREGIENDTIMPYLANVLVQPPNCYKLMAFERPPRTF